MADQVANRKPKHPQGGQHQLGQGNSQQEEIAFFNQKLQELSEKEKQNPGLMEEQKRQTIDSEPTTPTKEEKKAKKQAIVPEEEQMEDPALAQDNFDYDDDRYWKELMDDPKSRSKSTMATLKINEVKRRRMRSRKPAAKSQARQPGEQKPKSRRTRRKAYLGYFKYEGAKDPLMRAAEAQNLVTQPNATEPLKERLRARDLKSFKHKHAMPAELILRGEAHAMNTGNIAETQIKVARRLWKNAVSHGGHYAKMGVILEEMIQRMMECEPNQAIKLLLENLSFQFKSWVIQGNAIIKSCKTPINFIKESSNLIYHLSLDIMKFYENQREGIKSYIKIFEPQVIDAANTIGMDVVTVYCPLSPGITGGQVWLLKNNMVDFTSFWIMFLGPYAKARKLETFMCCPCKSLVLSTDEVVNKQTHLKDKIFGINWLTQYATEDAQLSSAKMAEAWKHFRRLFLDSLPKDDPNRIRTADNLEMPTLLIPGDNYAKNIHKCFKKDDTKKEDDKEKVMKEEKIEEKQEADDEVQQEHEHDSKGSFSMSAYMGFANARSKKASNQTEKQLTKAKTNENISSDEVFQEELSEKKPAKELVKNAKLAIEDGYDEKGFKVFNPKVVSAN